VPQNKDLKRLVRARMERTGERYTEALAAILAQTKLEPVPAPWHMAGDRPADYEAGLLPDIHDGNRVVQLRLRPGIADPSGFGTLMQSISGSRYLGHRIRFSATVRAFEVTGWAGLWMRVDVDQTIAAAFDNMQDRALRETTDWTRPSIVLDVDDKATSVHFGIMLDGAGAVELTRPRFDEVDDSVPVTGTGGPLPAEPQALDFGVATPGR
jgi:hypothetical protein